MVPITEQETVIQFNRDGSICNIWTSDSTMITKLDKLCKTSPKYYKLVKDTKTKDGENAGKQYELSDKKLVSLRSTKTVRVMTDEQKEAAAKRMKGYRDAKRKMETNI